MTSQLAPVFLFESKDDTVISAANSVLFVEALKRYGIPSSTHLFTLGKHGVGLATDEPEERVWPQLFGQWLVDRRFLPRIDR